MKYLKFFLFSVLLIILTPACDQYEFGPGFTLRTKTGRITRNWVVDHVVRNGQDTITSNFKFSIEFDSDGEFSMIDTLENNGEDSIVMRQGAWEFSDGAEDILLVFTEENVGATGARIWTILRLSTEDLWFYEIAHSDTVSFYLRDED